MSEFVSKYLLHVSADTTIGGRAENQDDFKVIDTPLGCLAILCDGMGGGPGGKTASFVAKNAITQTVLTSSPQAKREDVLRRAIISGQTAIEQKVLENPSLAGMGSTAVVLLINDESAIIAHVGDSRCYHLRGKRILTCTQDHSLVGEMVQHKAMTEEEARTSPQSNVITRGLGSMNNHTPDVIVTPYCRGDRFFMCSDGVWGTMNKESLTLRLSGDYSLESIVHNLQIEVDEIGFSNGGHHDNHTAILLETQKDSKLKDKMNKQTILIISILAILLSVSLIFNIVGGNKETDGDKELRNQLEMMAKEVEELQPYKNRYTELVKDDEAVLAGRVEKLSKLTDSLRDVIRTRDDKIDSLRIELKNAKAAAKEKTTNGETKSHASKKGMEPTANIDEIIKLYDKLINLKCKNISSVVTEFSSIRGVIVESLTLVASDIPKKKGKVDNLIEKLNAINIQKNVDKDNKPIPNIISLLKKQQKEIKENFKIADK